MHEGFRRAAQFASRSVGTSWAFLIAFGVVAGWAIAGPFVGYSSNWQLAINTGTTIVTFLMVFLIQNTQNRDSTALHLKLDEIVNALSETRSELVDVEDAPEDEVNRLRKEFAAVRNGMERGEPANSRPPATP